ncbi:MAG: transglutaminase domain-containing protein, partial [Akkermansiaceae bacterium]
GLASCTGLSILLNNAFRAVGIPSRVAGTPAWTTKRGNHNWVEVWTSADKQWHFTEYYPDKSGKLDRGWLIGDAARANKNSIYHSIYASSWKPTGKHFPLVWNMRLRYVHAVNVTDRYVALGGDAVKKDVIELRLHYMVEKKRIPVELAIMQGDAKMGEGTSPKATDDMNRYFTVKARKGQIYTVAWKDPATGKVKHKQITTPKDKDWLTINLGE